MARPVVLVYQEFATTTVTPEIPELNCLVVGPSYWIKDYLDDKADIQTSSDYGTKDADNTYTPPAAFTDAITVAEPPGNKTGALLESTSVKVFFDEARVLIGEDVTTGGKILDTNIPHNKIDCSGASGAFITAMADMQAGDYVIIKNPAGGADLVKRITLVDTTAAAEAIYVNTNFTAGHATNDFPLRVEREVDDIEIGSSFVVVSGNEIKIQGGVTTTLTGEVTPRVVNYAKVYIEYMSLRQDLRSVDTVSSETDITTKIGKVDARNPLAGVCATALKNTTTPIQFFGIKSDNSAGHSECLEIIEGREDIYAIVPITENKSIISQYKTAVEALASVNNAETTGIPQKWRVVIGAQALVTSTVISGEYTAGQHKTVDGAIAGTPISSADPIVVFVDDDADFVAAGVRAGDILHIVSDTFGTSRVGEYTISEVYDKNRLRVSSAFPGADAAGSVQYYIRRGTGSTETTLPNSYTGGTTTASATVTTAIDRLAGVVDEYKGKLVTLSGNESGTYLIDASTVANPSVFTVLPADITTQTGVDGVITNPLLVVQTARVIATRRPFRRIIDNNATFTTDLVKATDLLEVPNPVTGTDYTTNTPYSYVVAYIPNENEIVLDQYEDVVAQDNEGGDTDLAFRISRALTKDDQVDELVTISQSFNSRRVVLVWPDSVDVDGLVDGSKTRSVSTTAEAADEQPGYYLAGAVGGMTSGLPSHQGFTNLSISGIDLLYHSTRYFSDSQLTELSDGGWFVFAQDSPSALPFCIHQLTTDPDTLETGEYSVVKNFDFVSLFFQDILDDYLGIYNINNETLSLLKQALNTGIDLLKLRSYAKIGAPLNSASVTSVAQHSTARDRVEVYMNVELPIPLNRIGLHLVSS